MDKPTKLTHFMNFLTDRALSWATAVWQGQNDFSTYEQFVSLFQHVFDHSPDGKVLSDKILSLKPPATNITEPMEVYSNKLSLKERAQNGTQIMFLLWER